MRNRSALPRMWFVDRIRVVPEARAHLLDIRDPAWDPAREAILFEDPGPVEPGGGGRVRIERLWPREIRAAVESPGSCLLVVSEIYYPRGWKARLDGKPVRILRADYALRAVVVPEGKHELVMRFDPVSFPIGLAVSLGVFGLAGIIIAGGAIRERRNG